MNRNREGYNSATFNTSNLKSVIMTTDNKSLLGGKRVIGIDIETYSVLIAVCDDDIMRGNMLQQTLIAAGYDVSMTLKLEEARNCIFRNEPDLVLLCADTPDGAAIDFCREIRSATTANIYFYSSDDTYGKIRASMAGCDGYISRTMRMELILAYIVSSMRRTERFKSMGLLSELGGKNKKGDLRA